MPQAPLCKHRADTVFTARQHAAMLPLSSSRRLVCGALWSEGTGASSQREKGTETKPGTDPLALRACPRGHRGSCGLDARIPACFPQKKGRDTRPRRRRVRAQRGGTGDKPPKTRPRAARAPASYGVGASGSPFRVRFALPARRSLVLRPTSLRFVARACALVPLNGAGLDRLRAGIRPPGPTCVTALALGPKGPRVPCPFLVSRGLRPHQPPGPWAAPNRRTGLAPAGWTPAPLRGCVRRFVWRPPASFGASPAHSGLRQDGHDVPFALPRSARSCLRLTSSLRSVVCARTRCLRPP